MHKSRGLIFTGKVEKRSYDMKWKQREQVRKGESKYETNNKNNIKITMKI